MNCPTYTHKRTLRTLLRMRTLYIKRAGGIGSLQREEKKMTATCCFSDLSTALRKKSATLDLTNSQAWAQTLTLTLNPSEYSTYMRTLTCAGESK